VSAPQGAPRRPDARRALERDVSRLRRRDASGAAFWRSLSVLGTVGWAIALPAAAGALAGHLLDARLGTGVHLTLVLLTAGVIFGGAIAWRVLREPRP
jgi:predicted F0F1-ATPase subunit